MRIHQLDISHVRIPLKRRVSHASFTRGLNDSLIVRCQLSTGEVGWGEGLPRPYVTGETLETAWVLADAIVKSHLTADCQDVTQVLQLLNTLKMPSVAGQRDCFGNSVRCACELAILDAFLNAFELPLRSLIPLIPDCESIYSPRDVVYYSGVITSSKPTKAMLVGGIYRWAGFTQCKLKVGKSGIDDAKLVRQVRRAVGPRMDLRIDVNEAWTPETLVENVTPLLNANLSGIEQPVPHSQINGLARIRPEIPLPVILDESLCSYSDAQNAIEEGWGDVFNIRLSKCGGFVPAVKLAMLANQAKLASQLGCQVGETGILTAAGRHFATGIAGLRYLEGSFDRFLVKERLTTQDRTFGWGGKGESIPHAGLGITVDETSVQRVTVKKKSLVS